MITLRFSFAHSLRCLLFFAIFFLASCSVNQNTISTQSVDISKEDRVWIEKFFKDFFLMEPTIYTLFGSKPMSAISLCCATKEEWLLSYANFIQDYPEEKKQKALARFEKYINDYDLPINWKKWVSWSSKNLNRSFLFSKRATYAEDLFCIYILNVQEMAWTLQKHYSLISRELDMEFDPLQVVLEFEDLSSPFWEKVFNNHFVQGILHGYGTRNSYFFDRQMHLEEKNAFDLYSHPLFRSAIDRKGKKKDLPLPRFRSFFADLSQDPVYKKYKREKQQIRKVLKKRHNFDIILNQLGYQPNSQSAEITFN